jgi:hypothetical protein
VGAPERTEAEVKSIIASASALLLSGTAMAMPAPTVQSYGAGTYAWAASPQAMQAAWTGAMDYTEAASWTGDKPTEFSDAQIAEKDAWVASHPVGSDMAAVKTSADDKPMEFSDAQIAEKDLWVAAHPAGTDSWAEKPVADGQGGPFEPVATAEASSWPACDPGPGDDRCIQLYEPGVRGAYAQWSAGRERMAMGGPLEAVSADKAVVATHPTMEPTGVTVAKTDMAMDHANMVDATRTAEEMQSASVYGKTDTTYTGVGGPLEEVRDYPLCRSRSDDRCQQGS